MPGGGNVELVAFQSNWTGTSYTLQNDYKFLICVNAIGQENTGNFSISPERKKSDVSTSKTSGYGHGVGCAGCYFENVKAGDRISASGNVPCFIIIYGVK